MNEREEKIKELAEAIGLDIKQLYLRSEKPLNVEEFSDLTYVYFLFDTASGGYQVNRYNDNASKTVATGTTRPTTLAQLQSLTYV